MCFKKIVCRQDTKETLSSSVAFYYFISPNPSKLLNFYPPPDLPNARPVDYLLVTSLLFNKTPIMGTCISVVGAFFVFLNVLIQTEGIISGEKDCRNAYDAAVHRD